MVHNYWEEITAPQPYSNKVWILCSKWLIVLDCNASKVLEEQLQLRKNLHIIGQDILRWRHEGDGSVIPILWITKEITS
jgi:hypothetical protein